MQGKARPGPDQGRNQQSPESKDADVQRAVLALILEAHPKRLTIPHLTHEIDQGDSVERAVRDLVGIGLLECGGVSVWATDAALQHERLELP